MGADITLLSGGDQKYQGAKLDSGNDIAIVSGGSVTFEAVKDLHQESHEKSKGNLAWQSSKGKGQTDETLRQTQLIAQGNVAIKAVEGLKIDIKHIDQQSVSQAIDAMVKADPNLAWLKEAEKRGDVDWRQVREIHDSWKYSNSGLGAAPSLVISIVAAAYLGPVYGAMASNLAIGTINNKGDLGRGLKEAASTDNLKRYAITAATAYLAENYFDDILKTKTNPFTQKVTVDLSSLSGVGRFAANQAMQSVTSTALSKAVGLGGSFSDALKDSLYNTVAAAGFNAIGDFGKTHGLEAGDAQMVVMHAVMGGLAAEARGGSFAAGAAGAGLNEALVGDLDKLISSYSPANREALLTMSSQLVGILGVLVQNNNATADQLETGAWTAKSSTQYNYLLHNEIQARAKEVKGCGGEAKCEEDVLKRYADLDKARNENLPGLCQSDPGKCLAVMKQLAYESGANDAFVDSLRHEDVRAAVGVLLTSQSNDEAITAIQQELIRLKYGDRTAFALQVLQMAAAGNLTKNAKVDAKGIGSGSSGAKGIVNSTSHKADDIRFSQNTVTFNKTDKDGGAFTYSDLVKSMKSDGWKGDPVDVVRMPDGKLTSIDNTRIAAAREAGIDVKATVRGFDDLLSASEIKRFTIPKKGFVPKTWGEAITGRINKQTGGFSKDNPYGASQPPRITGRE